LVSSTRVWLTRCAGRRLARGALPRRVPGWPRPEMIRRRRRPPARLPGWPPAQKTPPRPGRPHRRRPHRLHRPRGRRPPRPRPARMARDRPDRGLLAHRPLTRIPPRRPPLRYPLTRDQPGPGWRQDRMGTAGWRPSGGRGPARPWAWGAVPGRDPRQARTPRRRPCQGRARQRRPCRGRAAWACRVAGARQTWPHAQTPAAARRKTARQAGQPSPEAVCSPVPRRPRVSCSDPRSSPFRRPAYTSLSTLEPHPVAWPSSRQPAPCCQTVSLRLAQPGNSS
jgi:hypothetical protein